ncbi:alpha/beta fold hydrolase [Phenylobacterium soli]|uniref:Alpha/beta hydrolase n=1 Tax=Phenylobacterium soli TaxID=2170551 RepID=A0A328AER4_9CAUL|nr:alpha/beta hydrolase [Phenylobacterium soli]RAK53139.1 alpha/beta hydrolase [Phenylobacterium soli]
MPRARNGAVELEYETFGDDRPETILLINGLGSQMTRWPEPFCERLVARGYRAIRFDNRDVGLSSWLDGQSYTLSDMAADAMAVLDAAGVERAHVAGVSMGGMITQKVAIDHPHRVLSITSIMSAPGVGPALQSTPEAAAVLNTPPPDPAADFEAFVAHGVKNARIIGSPGYPWDEAALRERVIAEHRRAFNPEGVARQRRAIFNDGDRAPDLAKLSVPAVVVHGTHDPLVQPIGGELTAKAVPGAELRVVEGMGHDLPPGLYDTIVDAIVAAASRARAAA